MAKLHFDEIDIVKGIAILFVLWHHSFIKFPIYMLDIPWCKYAMAIHGTFYLNVFFLVSGYLFAHSKPRTFTENFKKKASRLLIPYLGYEAINLGVKLALPQLVNRKVGGQLEYVEDMIFKGGELWFVYVLFIIFLIWPPILHRLNKKALMGVIVLLMVVGNVLPGNLLGGIFLYPKVISYSVYFLVGYLLRNMDRNILMNNRNFGIVTVLFVVFCCLLVQVIHIPFVWQYVVAFIGCWFVWALSFQLLKVKGLDNALSFCGKYSLSFYWLNGFALVPARKIVVKMLHVESTPVIAISIFLMCVVSEVIAINVIKKIPYVRVLVGM